MSWLLDALTDAYAQADELDRPHDTEYDGGHYVTPSILQDDGKENGTSGSSLPKP